MNEIKHETFMYEGSREEMAKWLDREVGDFIQLVDIPTNAQFFTMMSFYDEEAMPRYVANVHLVVVFYDRTLHPIESYRL